MAKVYLDEINAFLSSGTNDVLAVDAREGSNIGNALTSFVSTSGEKLVGVHWDNYRETFDSFNKAIQARIALANKLGAAIEEALTLLKNYLGEDQMLDSSQLGEYKTQRQNCQNCIDNLNSMLSQTTTVRYTDSAGNVVTQTVPLYDANEIRAQIATAQETLKELDRLITKIEGLDAVYAQAEAILQAAFQDITVFQGQVEAITPHPTYSYKKA